MLGVIYAIYQAPSVYAQHSALVMNSERREYIAAGVPRYFLPPEANFQVTRKGYSIHAFVTVGQGCWTLRFNAPGGVPLTVGRYENALRDIVQGPYSEDAWIDPGMAVSGGEVCSAGRGCNQLRGSFEVKEIAFGEDGSVTKFHVAFKQNCEALNPELRGELFYNASAAPPPEHHIISPTEKFATAGPAFQLPDSNH